MDLLGALQEIKALSFTQNIKEETLTKVAEKYEVEVNTISELHIYLLDWKRQREENKKNKEKKGQRRWTTAERKIIQLCGDQIGATMPRKKFFIELSEIMERTPKSVELSYYQNKERVPRKTFHKDSEKYSETADEFEQLKDNLTRLDLINNGFLQGLIMLTNLALAGQEMKKQYEEEVSRIHQEMTDFMEQFEQLKTMMDTFDAMKKNTKHLEKIG